MPRYQLNAHEALTTQQISHLVQWLLRDFTKSSSNTSELRLTWQQRTSANFVQAR